MRFLKYLASFRKRTWELSDYPVEIRPNRTTPGWPPAGSHLRAPRFQARVAGWLTMSGLGDSPEDAVADLRARFDRRRAADKTLPRPGAEHPDIEFAPADRMAALEDVAPKFFREVLEMDYGECVVTDESSLWDFHAEADYDRLLRKIEEVYGADARDIESGSLADILERLRA